VRIFKSKVYQTNPRTEKLGEIIHLDNTIYTENNDSMRTRICLEGVGNVFDPMGNTLNRGK
jgi:hypothetical protein